METGKGATAEPLNSLDELLSWSVINVDPRLMGKPMSNVVQRKTPNQPKTLVCHDMRGNYLEDRFSDGCATDSAFYITQWWYMDVFVYFSHNLVTIPPVGWINAAHLHGVSVLGTFITEFDDGYKICNEFLTDRSTVDKICRTLADIALVYQFDGWLLNIENKIESDNCQMDNLQYFVSRLTELCKSKLGKNSLVIWYDSVTIEGDLRWQNELNKLNKPFFDLCDGIFLNYGWTEQHLSNSLENAVHRISDVYVGVDVFGRNCYGGGGFNCRNALTLIRKYHLSVALFATGWIFQCLDEKNFEQNHWNFWSLLAPFVECNKIERLPFSTNFNPGKFYSNGSCHFNLAAQQLQPHCFCTIRSKSLPEITPFNEPTFCPPLPPANMRHIFCRDSPGFVHVIRSSTEYQVVRLFCCDIDLTSTVDITLKCSSKNWNNVTFGLLCTAVVGDKGFVEKLVYLPSTNGNEYLSIFFNNEPSVTKFDLELHFDDKNRTTELVARVPSKKDAQLRSINFIFGEKNYYLSLLNCDVRRSAKI